MTKLFAAPSNDLRASCLHVISLIRPKSSECLFGRVDSLSISASFQSINVEECEFWPLSSSVGIQTSFLKYILYSDSLSVVVGYFCPNMSYFTDLQVALDHGKAAGIVKAHDRVVVCQKVGDSSVVKIIELD